MKNISFIILFLFINVSIGLSQWQQVFNSSSPFLAVSGNNIYAGTPSGSVYLSDNNGTNWTQTSFSGFTLASLAASGNNIFAGTTSNGLFLSTNNGINWTQTSINIGTIRSIGVSGNNVFVAGGAVYLSTNSGQTWSSTGLGQIISFAFSGSNIFAGSDGPGVYKSTNNGANWSLTSLGNQTVYSLTASGNNVYAGTNGNGVYLSTNSGQDWTQTALTGQVVASLEFSNNAIFAGTIAGGVYISYNNGANWIQRNEGLSNLQIKAFGIYNNYIFASNFGSTGIYRRPLSELIGISQISTEVPDNFTLSQNYPNPFNPVTNIKFSVPASSFVKLVVYDITGREVETLVNQSMTAGSYKADWNASNYSSGLYFYTISSNGFSETKKMLMIK